MKRDMDLIRALMLKLEALPVNGHAVFAVGPHDEELAVSGASVDQIAYHLRLIYEQGFLDSPGEPLLSGKIPFRGFTWTGHDFLDSIRDEDVWRKTKTHAEQVGAWTVDILSGLAKAVIKAKLKAATRNGHDWADRFPAMVDAASRECLSLKFQGAANSRHFGRFRVDRSNHVRHLQHLVH